MRSSFWTGNHAVFDGHFLRDQGNDGRRQFHLVEIHHLGIDLGGQLPDDIVDGGDGAGDDQVLPQALAVFRLPAQRALQLVLADDAVPKKYFA